MKFKLILTLFFSASAIAFLPGCKKAKVEDYNISARIGTTDYNFPLSMTTTNLNSAGTFGYTFKGFQTEESSTSLAITVSRPTTLTTGIYVENAGANPVVKINFSYHYSAYSFYIWSYGAGNTEYSEHLSSTNPLTVYITEITGNYIRGTFNGELQVNGGTQKAPITNGVFYIKL